MTNYTKEDMEKAIKAIKDGQMSQRKVADTFGVPLITSNDIINGKYKLDKKGTKIDWFNLKNWQLTGVKITLIKE